MRLTQGAMIAFAVLAPSLGAAQVTKADLANKAATFQLVDQDGTPQGPGAKMQWFENGALRSGKPGQERWGVWRITKSGRLCTRNAVKTDAGIKAAGHEECVDVVLTDDSIDMIFEPTTGGKQVFRGTLLPVQ